jgi:hypothetical protein
MEITMHYPMATPMARTVLFPTNAETSNSTTNPSTAGAAVRAHLLRKIYRLNSLVMEDRYGGVYSGAQFLCWPIAQPAMSREEWERWTEGPYLGFQIPDGASDDDVTCSEFWSTFGGVCGKGNTAAAAQADMRRQLRKLPWANYLALYRALDSHNDGWRRNRARWS